MSDVQLRKQRLQRAIGTRPCSPQNVGSAISDLTNLLALDISQDEVQQLVGAISAGGEHAMALALSLASALADADYRYSPQLADTLTRTLDRPEFVRLPVSHLIRMKLVRWRPKR
jgi:hypothetical protein